MSIAQAIDEAPEGEVRAPSRRRRSAAWVAIAMLLLAIGGAGAILSGAGDWSPRTMLDPESVGPNGARAIVEVLRDQGVDVRIARTYSDAQRALEGDEDTLVMLDTPALSDEGVASVTGAATDVVLVDPRSRTLDLLLPGSSLAGYAPASDVEPDCAVGAAQRAGALTPGALFAAADGPSCYPVDGGWGLISTPLSDGTMTAVDGRELFTNEHLATGGNAALALNLMGEHDTLVWYLPDAGDTDLADTELSLGELTPPWVSPVIVLLLTAGVAAGVWRGRRFGPLVAERLPVTVRASETTEGRARLYAQSRDAAHAAAELRRATQARLARMLHLGAQADPREIADAAASVLAIDRRGIHATLIDDLPATDADLVTLYSRLRQLEDAVAAAAHPERNAP
jgi:hypothetical protein